MPGDRNQLPKWVRYSGLGLELGIVILGLTLLGAALDRRFGSDPWATLAGFSTGLFGGLYKFVRSAQDAMQAASTSDHRTDDDDHG